MKRTIMSLLATTVLASAVPAVASAQQWVGVDQRQAQLDQRIEAGVRSGQLTRPEAGRLQAEFQDIVSLEARYRANGLSANERADLDRRFDELSARIREERRDNQQADRRDRDGRDGRDGWRGVNERQVELEERIEAGIRSGQLSRPEAARLRAEFQDIQNLENRYRVNGLSPDERADLTTRLDQLSARVRLDRTDQQRGDRRGRWENLNQRQAQFQQRLDRAVRDGRISSRQAMNLRLEYNRIANLEQQYRRGGLNPTERADLDRRFDRLQANFRASVNSSNYGYGYGQAPNLFDYLFGSL